MNRTEERIKPWLLCFVTLLVCWGVAVCSVRNASLAARLQLNCYISCSDWNQIFLSVLFIYLFCKSSPWGNKTKTPEGWDHDPPSVAERLSFPSLSSCTLMTVIRLKKIKANECFSVTGADGTLAAMMFSHLGGAVSKIARVLKLSGGLIDWSITVLRVWNDWYGETDWHAAV